MIADEEPRELEDWEKAEFELEPYAKLSCPICFAIVRKDLWFLHKDWHLDGSR
jgi:hypothetical protein